ncbi:hypothetical protein ACWCP6_26500 [Streptomyces sp. NPDC002004]
MTAESDHTKNSGPARAKKETGDRGAATGGQTAKRAASKAGSATKSTAGQAGTKARAASGSAEAATRDARKSAVSTARSAGETTKQGAHAALTGLQAGRRTVTAQAAKVTSVATTAWTVIRQRKAIAAGAAMGVAGLAGAAFAVGRSTAKPQTGPLTRLAHGRI